MDVPVVFAAVYATAMTLAALGLDRVGRAGVRGPVRARPDAGGAPGDGPPGVGTPGEGPAGDGPVRAWPHTGSAAVHTVVASVAAVAGLLIAVVAGIGHHDGGELALLAVPVVLSSIVLRRLYTRLRAGTRW
jgi:hypothetical protein